MLDAIDLIFYWTGWWIVRKLALLTKRNYKLSDGEYVSVGGLTLIFLIVVIYQVCTRLEVRI